ncbi:MAG: hypothetical protein ACLFWR_07395, partial [Acidimicrobiales bacterium]
MHASHRRKRASALSLAIFGIFALLAAIAPGMADAQGVGEGNDNDNGTAGTVTCKDFGDYDTNREEGHSGEWGSTAWVPDGEDGYVDLVVEDGYEVWLCLKKGSDKGDNPWGGPQEAGPYTSEDTGEEGISVKFPDPDSDAVHPFSHYDVRWESVGDGDTEGEIELTKTVEGFD